MEIKRGEFSVYPKRDMLRLFMGVANAITGKEIENTKSSVDYVINSYISRCEKAISQDTYYIGMIDSLNDNNFSRIMKRVIRKNIREFDTYKNQLKELNSLFNNLLNFGISSYDEKEEMFIEMFDRLPCNKLTSSCDISNYFIMGCNEIKTKEDFDDFNNSIDLIIFNELSADYGAMCDCLMKVKL